MALVARAGDRFSAAHTLTLAASIYGVVRLSPAVVEPLIALSIAYVAIAGVGLYWFVQRVLA